MILSVKTQPFLKHEIIQRSEDAGISLYVKGSCDEIQRNEEQQIESQFHVSADAPYLLQQLSSKSGHIDFVQMSQVTQGEDQDKTGQGKDGLPLHIPA